MKTPFSDPDEGLQTSFLINFSYEVFMSGTLREGIFGTFIIVGLFLVLTNADGFGRVMTAFTDFYTKSVGALQGKG